MSSPRIEFSGNLSYKESDFELIFPTTIKISNDLNNPEIIFILRDQSETISFLTNYFGEKFFADENTIEYSSFEELVYLRITSKQKVIGAFAALQKNNAEIYNQLKDDEKNFNLLSFTTELKNADTKKIEPSPVIILQPNEPANPVKKQEQPPAAPKKKNFNYYAKNIGSFGTYSFYKDCKSGGSEPSVIAIILAAIGFVATGGLAFLAYKLIDQAANQCAPKNNPPRLKK